MTPSATFGATRHESLLVLLFAAISAFFSDVAETARRNGDFPYAGL